MLNKEKHFANYCYWLVQPLKQMVYSGLSVWWIYWIKVGKAAAESVINLKCTPQLFNKQNANCWIKSDGLPSTAAKDDEREASRLALVGPWNKTLPPVTSITLPIAHVIKQYPYHTFRVSFSHNWQKGLKRNTERTTCIVKMQMNLIPDWTDLKFALPALDLAAACHVFQ